jgi:hypothetical protein
MCGIKYNMWTKRFNREVYSGGEMRLYVENVRGNVGDKFQHRLTLSLRRHVLFTSLQKYIQKHII